MPIYSLGERRVELRGEHHYIAPDATLAGSIVLEEEEKRGLLEIARGYVERAKLFRNPLREERSAPSAR